MDKREIAQNSEREAVRNPCVGKTITSVSLKDDLLKMSFDDNTEMVLWDDTLGCCEVRHTSSDDELTYYVGSKLLGIEIADVRNGQPGSQGQMDILFLNVTTSKGVFTLQNHNDHNGYYGGFTVVFRVWVASGKEYSQFSVLESY